MWEGSSKRSRGWPVVDGGKPSSPVLRTALWAWIVLALGIWLAQFRGLISALLALV